MNACSKAVIQELRNHVDKEYRDHGKTYFVDGQYEEMNILGVRKPQVRAIARKYQKDIGTTKRELFDAANDILETNIYEATVVAFQWALRAKKEYEPADFHLFEQWLKKYVHDWSACDDLCGGPLGHILIMYPELAVKTVPWRAARNRWVQRASAVALIPGVRKGLFLKEIQAAATALLQTEDDLVQKAYGWALKEAAATFQDEVFAYVMKNKDIMPRTALRYAIEKMPRAQRNEAMKKQNA